jgi:hypothetical protein
MISEDVRKGVWHANDCGICLQGLVCYVMEYIQGCDMGTQLMRTRQFTKKTAQFYAAEIHSFIHSFIYYATLIYNYS